MAGEESSGRGVEGWAVAVGAAAAAAAAAANALATGTAAAGSRSRLLEEGLEQVFSATEQVLDAFGFGRSCFLMGISLRFLLLGLGLGRSCFLFLLGFLARFL